LPSSLLGEFCMCSQPARTSPRGGPSHRHACAVSDPPISCRCLLGLPILWITYPCPTGPGFSKFIFHPRQPKGSRLR
jgi:hypothetical protein